MPRYGRDYDRNFVERAGDRVRRWFGADDEDRGYDWRAAYRERDWGREPRGRDAGRGYPARGYDRGYPVRGYDREFGAYPRDRDDSRGWGRYHGARGDYGADFPRGWGRERQRGPRRGDSRGPGPRRDPLRRYGPWEGEMWSPDVYDSYAGGAYSGRGLFRSARGGAVAPGRYFTGYGVGSAGGYEPY